MSDTIENLIQGKRVLRLTLHKKAFEITAKGEKHIEYRRASNWIVSRLRDKKGNKFYHYILYTNGYAKDSDRCLVNNDGFCFEPALRLKHTFSNGLQLSFKGEPHYCIFNGEVVAVELNKYEKKKAA